MTPAALPEVTAVHSALLAATTARLRQQQSRINDCLARLSSEHIWARGNENSNSIGNLVLHLCGNLGQWVLSGLGNVPDTRDRDSEFATRSGLSAAELASLLNQRLDQVIPIIEALPPERLLETVSPQGYSLPVLEVLLHITEHFYYHTGQILLLTKLYLDVDLGYYRHLTQNNQLHAEKVP